MRNTLEALSREALVLPPDQRLTLACRLLDSVDLEPEPGAAAAWEAEMTQRIERFDAGASQPISASEVFARLRRIAPGK
jgi:putative addiction module component (TIGR02574 family)